MKAAVLHSENEIIYQDIEISECQPNEVKVKVMAAGICGSDTHKMVSKWKYPLPAIMGHEFAGYVVEKGKDVTNVEIGDRVAAIPFIPCNECEYCLRGQFSLCENHGMIGSKSFGAFAEFVNIPAKNVLPIGEMSFEDAAMIEPSAVSLHGVLNIHPQLGDVVAVFGVGTIGILAIQWLRVAGVKEIIAIDISDKKLQDAMDLGCEKSINPLKEDLIKKIYEYTNGLGVDIAFECAGSKITQEQCLLITRKQGKVGYLGIAYSDVTLSEKAFENIFRRELTLKGFWNSYSAPFPGKEWMNTIEFVQQGKIKLKELVSHRYKLEDTQKAFNMMINREEEYNKVMIIPNEELE
ncbi:MULTISPECIES: galactitol-1-phosphate 5-dehydrogenase [Heyndrickxia]|uniref:Galactitol-1-phosphate 5-dehydrogenase n=1 Tax=Heyndrickxia sporothermodurans TaxID=46224 RepID=A0A150KKV0_9BACI|nr:galactitol-1-phosphate 5-dehydrogenase [Heyndrickxia sporothermodurans]KYC84191.1 Galactitol-1-phosphate 5-dehydrogenase [Heyndrickxia sporothermodurans]MBL5772836.1 galactitol-1-phosphate 5-dehydrogenase [Heyndrickxia sporothermodurans]MBL5775570.1 galactitol-1-phosphate 5-dehydrogenase [Heyndrickxia sporothermodurans]MBL5779021.1 galactitol-1-phosphate 5-dehydrogenase [Heyndrickxia sporothermodurans]MBL5782844.1 galactitol-1-phosphate 5-dehydrogenase [Heyndrickxia sporothermodurans]